MLALVYKLPELGAKRCQIRELAFHFGQMSACDPVNLRAWLTSVIGQAQQFADVVERETKIAATADEAQAGKVALGIGPVIAASPRRGRQ